MFNFQLRIINYELREKSITNYQLRITRNTVQLRINQKNQLRINQKIMKDNLIQEKTYAFAVRIVKLYQYLTKNKKDLVLGKQLVRSGTSIGANVEEAVGAQSQNDFIHKLSISYKEARETRFWLRLLKDTDYLTEKEADSLLEDIEEILRIIGKIQVTMKNK